jgi:hypothetical protein
MQQLQGPGLWLGEEAAWCIAAAVLGSPCCRGLVGCVVILCGRLLCWGPANGYITLQALLLVAGAPTSCRLQIARSEF